MKRFLLLLTEWLLWFSPHLQGQITMQYWFDGQYVSRHEVVSTSMSWQPQIDVGHLSEGLHTLCLHVTDTSGRWSSPRQYVFYRAISYDSIHNEYDMGYSYWYDHDYGNRQTGTIGNGSLLLDVSQLREGLHTISMQIGHGRTAQLQEYVFFKPMTFDSLNYSYTMDYSYWYDHDYSSRQTGTIGNGSLLLDVSHLAGGLHTICIQFGENRYAQLQQYVFYKPIQFDTLNDNFMQTYTYWYDRDYSTRQSGSIGNGALLLDVAQLSEGIHTISMQLGEGNRSQLQHYVFIKPFRNTLDSLYHITRYDYTLNGNEGQRHITQVTPCDTLQLVSLLPVDTLPIRSMCFHFNPNEGNPVLNAKNDIRLRFWTDGKRFAEYSTQYIDENVVDTVYADTIERGAVKTIAAPTNNSIHWFKLAAGTGDSLSFCTSKRCTIQLYAPSGEMLFMTSGDSVLSWFGCHAWEDGVYYLAVHDAEDTGNMTVSYQWVYRYAVLAWDVHRVGNGGISTITFEGNGFDSLTAVFFELPHLDSVSIVSIYHRDNVTIDVVADFTGKIQGQYIARFMFGDEILQVNNVFIVEDSIGIELDLSVQNANTFLSGTPAHYRVSIINRGNSTAYDVPVVVEINSSVSFDNILSIDITDSRGEKWGDIKIRDFFEDTISEDVIVFFEDKIGDNLKLGQFLRMTDSLDSTEIGFTQQLVSIPPYGQYSFDIDVQSVSSISCYVSVPSRWITLNTREEDTLSQAGTMSNIMLTSFTDGRKEEVNSSFCCQREKLECWAELATSIIGFAPLEACPFELSNYYFFYVSEMACSSTGSLGERFMNFQEQQLNDPSLRKSVLEKGANTLIGCVTGRLARSVGELIRRQKNLNNARNAALRQKNQAYFMVDDKTRNVNYLRNRASQLFESGNYEEYRDLSEQIVSLEREVEHWRQVAYTTTEEIRNLDVLIAEVSSQLGEKGNELHLLYEWLSRAKDLLQVVQNSDCRRRTSSNPDCNDDEDGGEQSPVSSYDPNDITGYTAESGSRYIGAEQIAMPYMIEFENDTAFATAHAHTVVVRDTLDGGVFDLNSFSATAFSIGENMEPINGVQSFVRTMDMRPSINVLAQVELDYRIDTTFGVATWTFSSLDPITLQPTTDPTLGFLPANFNGDGIGEVYFTINRKIPLADSSVIANKAYITFDNEDPIATSTWVNIVDNTCPVSTIDSILVENGMVSVAVRATDVLSGIWRYNVYGKIGEMWMPMTMNVSADSVAVFDADTSRFSGFQSTAIDSAGNVEPLGGLHQAIIVYDTVVVTACDSYMWFDSVYNTSGDYSRRISATTAGGNDTLKTLLLTINHSGAGDTIAVACDNFIWHGVSISTTGTSTYQTTNAVGCDSTVTLHLTINHSMYTSEVVTACDSWQDYSSDTMLVTTATAANGCDSTHTIALTVNHSVATAEVVTACDEWQGYTGDTVLVTTATAANGCDSTHTISLIINNTVETQITDTAEGSYTWHDNEYTESGTYVWQGTTADGCDSTVTLMLVIEQDIGIEVIGSQAQVSVYPNPTDGWLTIGSDMVVAVEVFDHAGRRVAVFNDTNRIYLGDLPSGGYLLNIHLDHRVVTQRVQLNR